MLQPINSTTTTAYVASFDIGLKHFAYCVGNADEILDWNVHNLIDDDDDNAVGGVNDANVCVVNESSLLARAPNKRGSAAAAAIAERSFESVCVKLSRLLDSRRTLWNACGEFIIERQMSKNVNATRLAQHLWTWLTLTYPTRSIVFVSAKAKLPADIRRNVSRSRLKAATVEYIMDVLRKRGDNANVAFVAGRRKRDDLCDAYAQLLHHVATATAKGRRSRRD